MDIAALLQVTLLTNLVTSQNGVLPDGALVRLDTYSVQMQAICNQQMGDYRLRFVAVGDFPYTNFTIATRLPPLPVITNTSPIPPPVAFATNIPTLNLPGPSTLPMPLLPQPRSPSPPSAPVMNVPPPPAPLPPLPARPVP